MPFMKAGWATIQTSRTMQEVVPDEDVIEHKGGFACKCKPEVLSEVYQGEVYWKTIHNSFDEFLDDEETEPYKGL